MVLIFCPVGGCLMDGNGKNTCDKVGWCVAGLNFDAYLHSLRGDDDVVWLGKGIGCIAWVEVILGGRGESHVSHQLLINIVLVCCWLICKKINETNFHNHQPIFY